MIQMHFSTKQITDTESRLAFAMGDRSGEQSEFGISRYKLVYIEWISNKVLLPYSTGNYIHYPVINHNGKKLGRMYRASLVDQW